MNSRSQRVLNDPGPERVVTPLSGPSYGAYNVVKRKWRKPLRAVIADAVANCAEVSARLSRGVYAPDFEGEAYYRQIYDDLRRTTRQQLEALHAFFTIDWRE
jgi:hypothetical protein